MSKTDASEAFTPSQEPFHCPPPHRALSADVLETYRSYLLLIANRELSPELKTIVGASDLVQESLIEAQQSLENFAGESEAQLLGWLRRILLNNLTDAARRHGRAVECTVSYHQLPTGESPSTNGFIQKLVDDVSSPSHNAAASEQWDRLLQAIDGLPQDLQEIVRLRNFELLTFEEIGSRLGRSKGTICRAWYSAIERLQQELGDESNDRREHTH